jgi:hypothetical protein
MKRSSIQPNPENVRAWQERSRRRMVTRAPLRCRPRGDLSGTLTREVYDLDSKPRKAMKKRGPKVRSWEEERAKLKRRFLAVGIITCELRYAGCAFDDFLGFAHAEKRRNLSREDLSVVILACNFCHDTIEIDPRMKEIVTAVIAAREVQP